MSFQLLPSKERADPLHAIKGDRSRSAAACSAAAKKEEEEARVEKRRKAKREKAHVVVAT
jgi:hypothetical protein